MFSVNSNVDDLFYVNFFGSRSKMHNFVFNVRILLRHDHNRSIQVENFLNSVPIL